LLVEKLLQGQSFEAHAKPFAEFELCFDKEQILRLKYLFDGEVETIGGIAFQCEYNSQNWQLQFFRTPYLQRESYRLLCGGNLVLATGVLRLLRSADINFSDGAVWHCRPGLLETVVTDSKAVQVLHASPRPGLVMGGSRIRIDEPSEYEHILPMLIVLLHFTTHTSQ
jgi:hypothetical protein